MIILTQILMEAWRIWDVLSTWKLGSLIFNWILPIAFEYKSQKETFQCLSIWVYKQISTKTTLYISIYAPQYSVFKKTALWAIKWASNDYVKSIPYMQCIIWNVFFFACTKKIKNNKMGKFTQKKIDTSTNAEFNWVFH